MILKAGHQPVVILPAHLESNLVDAQRAFGDHALTINFVHQAGTGTRMAPIARLPNQRLIDTTLIGEAGSYILPRGRDGKRALLPENWRQPGARVMDGEALLLQARMDGEGQLFLSGYGAAKPIGSAAPLALIAKQQDGQTFEIALQKTSSLAA
jgi:hypothetical protein